MKKYISFSLALTLFFCLMTYPTISQAQKQKKIYNRPHCKLFLKGGKVVDSYVMAGHNLINYSDSTVDTSDKPNALFPKVQKYYNTDIDSMQEWNDKYPENVLHRVPVKIRFSYKADSLEVDSLRYPSMVIHIYKGKNVDGFMAYSPLSGFRYLYKTKDMAAAHAYIGERHRITDQRKAFMVEEFKQYPRFVNFINSLHSNSFKDKPAYILYQLDLIIEEDKRK